MMGTLQGPTGAVRISPRAPSHPQRNGTVSEAALRYLWFHVSSQAVLRIREVLPEKHPSWKYTQELCQLFDALGKEYSKYQQVGRPWGPLAPQPRCMLALNLAQPLQECYEHTQCASTRSLPVHADRQGGTHTEVRVHKCYTPAMAHGCGGAQAVRTPLWHTDVL